MGKRNYIEWEEKYSVGIESIDGQHKVLFEMINNLFDEFMDTEKKENPDMVYQKLQIYIRKHFSYEEELFEKHGWENGKEHKHQHAMLIGEVEKIKAGMDATTDRGSCIRLLGLFKDWLGKHILVEDKGYSEYLKEKGVK